VAGRVGWYGREVLATVSTREVRVLSDDATPPLGQVAAEPAPERSAIDELGGYIRHQRESARLSLRKLAKLAGVSNPYLSQIERGLRKPSAEILQAIAKALEISSETLYVKAGILEERVHDEDLEAVVERDPHLTDAQRQALVEMYRSFRRLTELQGGRSSRRRALLDVVSVGGVDDEAIRAASPSEEGEHA
jgi:transcriptional regulator with XRE-family HTH domain